jgi:hypothetical protein
MAAPYDQPPTVEPADERPLSELLSDLTSQVGQLVRKEVELASAEIKVEVKRASKAGGALGAAGLAGYFALLLLSFALAWGLTELVPTWIAFTIVAVLWGAAAAVLFTTGKERLDKLNLKPEQTVETLKEDAEWARNRTR